MPWGLTYFDKDELGVLADLFKVDRTCSTIKRANMYSSILKSAWERRTALRFGQILCDDSLRLNSVYIERYRRKRIMSGTSRDSNTARLVVCLALGSGRLEDRFYTLQEQTIPGTRWKWGGSLSWFESTFELPT